MSNQDEVKAIVVHPRLYMRVNGKMEHVEPGTEIAMKLSDAIAKGKKLKIATAAKTVTVGKSAESAQAASNTSKSK